MRLFARRKARHARHGSLTGWAALASAVSAARRRPVVDTAITRPALIRIGRPPYAPKETR